MGNALFFAPEMILIGSTGRNSGKTVLAEALIRHFRGSAPVLGLKVTTIAQAGMPCHHGDSRCGACAISEGFILTEELDRHADKDTARLLKAGADRVFWLRSLHSALAEGYAAALEKIPTNTLIIAESNSLRELVQPGCFIMLANSGGASGHGIKPSAARVADLADITLKSPILDDVLQKLVGQIEVRLAG